MPPLGAILDMRDDFRGEMQLSSNIGRGIGSFIQQRKQKQEDDKIKQEEERQRISDQLVVETTLRGIREGLSPADILALYEGIPDITKSRMAMAMTERVMEDRFRQSDPAYQQGLEAQRINMAGAQQTQQQRAQQFPLQMQSAELGIQGQRQSLDQKAQQFPLQQEQAQLSNRYAQLRNQGLINDQEYEILSRQRQAEMFPIEKQSALLGNQYQQKQIDNYGQSQSGFTPSSISAELRDIQSDLIGKQYKDADGQVQTFPPTETEIENIRLRANRIGYDIEAVEVAPAEYNTHFGVDFNLNPFKYKNPSMTAAPAYEYRLVPIQRTDQPKQGKAGDRVLVYGPDGRKGRIPASQLEAALKQGYRKAE